MNTRFVGLLAAALALSAPLHAQSRSLTAFGSDRAFTRYLESLQPPPLPAPPAPPPPPVTFQGPVNPDAAVVTGRVTNAQGQPEAAVLVRIEVLNVGASTGADGTYRLVVPSARIRAGQLVTVMASRTGLSPVSRTLTLTPGTQLAQNFQMGTSVLLLEAVTIDCRVHGKEPISNTQHEGANEGGIVKVHGDHLVVLRGGRLVTVDIGGGRLRPVDAVNAFAPDRPPARWYNELLVSGGNAVVISYGSSDTTEINLFRIDARGRLAYRSTYLMRSDRHNSRGSYASRIVAGRLVIYAPVQVGYRDELQEWMPAMRRWRPGATEGAFRRTLPATRIYRPGRKPEWSDEHTLHTVTICGLARGELDCESSAVLAPEAAVFYVSPTAVYLWVDDEWRPAGRDSAMAYRLPLDGADPTALGVEGSPQDHLSFLESDDGFLNVLVRDKPERRGTERVGGNVRLLRVARDAFSDGRRAARPNAYRDLPGPREYDRERFVNRFAGQHLLYGEPASGAGGATLYVVGWRDGRAVELPLGGLKRIEAMGTDAVVVWSDTADLHLAGIRLEGEPRVAQQYVHRYDESHQWLASGIFYRHDGPGEGVIGLAFTGSVRPGWEQVFDESAAVLFLRNEGRQFRPAGELVSQVKCRSDEGNWCLYIDHYWHGSTRPFFIRGRVFALLGNEIVEGEVAGGQIREVARASFAPRALNASTR